MFAQATILLDQDPSEIYEFLVDIRNHIPLWEVFRVKDLANLPPDTDTVDCAFSLAHDTQLCQVSIHMSRPGSGLVTRVQMATGELAAEWRIFSDTPRTRVEINIEGQGGGLAASVSIRQLAPKILANLKNHFYRA